MNDELKTTRRRIKEITRRLERQLQVGGWLKIEHHFSHDGESDASTTVKWEYREATIEWNLAGCARLRDDELELTAIHEYVHSLLAPIASLVPEGDIHAKLEELATESIARVICAALAVEGGV
jgi:hypothetical protein